jgi:hypothetical protein
VSDQLNCSGEKDDVPRLQLTCTESDVDVYDIHNKPFLTRGIITLPLVYGNVVFYHEFIVRNGISESCDIGEDAAINHEFIFDDRSKTIFLARDKPDDILVVNQGPCAPCVKKEISKTLMTLIGNVRINVSPPSPLKWWRPRFKGNPMRWPSSQSFFLLPTRSCQREFVFNISSIM